MKRNNRRCITAIFFTILMILQSMSGAMDIMADELGKIRLAPVTGRYENKDITNINARNKEQPISENQAMRKEPVIVEEPQEYAEDQEVKEKRTENSKTYRMEDGTYVLNAYFEPIHKKEGDSYVDIDNTLENVSRSRSLPIYENKDGLYTFKVQDRVMSMECEKGERLTLTNDDANLQTYSVKENVILYSEAYKNIDMEYRLGGNAVYTNFYINGQSNIDTISYTLHTDGLRVKEESDALLFMKDDNVIFSYTKPQLFDAEHKIRPIEFSYTENQGNIKITIKIDKDWINDSQRIYPMTLSARAADDAKEINVVTAYNRSKDPNIISQYGHLFVGYEDGSLSGGYDFGISRTYVKVNDLNIGTDKEIISGKLKLYKIVSEPQQWNTLQVGKSEGYILPKDCTWNNKPSFSAISTTNIRSDSGWQEFDIKSYIEDIYKGKGNTLEIKATNESSAYSSNVFSSEAGNGLPKITITYKDAFDINPSLPIDTFDTELRIFSVLNKGFEAFSFDGIARPDSQVVFDLVEKGTSKVVRSETSKGNVSRYFVDPIYITKQIANTQTYAKDKVNYTTDYIYKDQIPKYDTVYEYRVKVKYNSSISVKDFRSDAFIKYKVKAGDNLRNISTYYGLTIDEIKSDNNLKTNIVKEDDVLLIRYKVNNDKVSEEVYTPPVRTVEYKAKYVNRGPRCFSGNCPIIDPVNATTGNYYYESTDFSFKDSSDYKFQRYYNSTGPQLTNMFGNGFTTPVERYISYTKKGNMLYFAGDGRIYEFMKSGNTFTARSEDRMQVSVSGDKVTIKDLVNESISRFDEYGYLISIEEKDGRITKINYDANGLITSINIGSKRIVFTYNDAKTVKDITLPDGKKVYYAYDTKRNLTKFTDTNGKSEIYAYDSKNYLRSITDKNGSVMTQNTYDGEGRVTKQIDGNGNTSTISYGTNQTTVTNGDGSKDVYQFNANYDITSIVQNGVTTSSYTYDGYRNITSQKDEKGSITRYAYSGLNLSKTTYPDGTYEEYQYDGNRNVTYQKDREGNVTRNTYSGNDMTATSDTKNMNTRYEYDSAHRVIKETDQYGAWKSYTYTGNQVKTITYSNGLVESFAYDANGNTLKESDNKGKNTTYVFDNANRITQKNYQDGTNEQWTYDGNGNIRIYKDRIGGITTNTYDKNNNLIRAEKGGMTTSKKYDAINQLMSETDEQGRTTSYTYDTKGNKLTETDMYGNVTTFVYDSDDHVIKTTDSFGNTEINEYDHDNLIRSTSKEGLVTSYEYDALNREIKKTNPDSTIETKEYSGLNLVKEVNDRGTIIEHFYDRYGRVIKTLTTYTDGVTSTTSTTYDMYGNVIETDTDGAITKNTYDVYKQLLSTTDPLGHTTRREYDLEGNVVKEIDAAGNATITAYDVNHNVISVTDKNGNKETKRYNALGQLISERDALGFVKTYRYNNKGQLSEVIDPYKRSITYTYDAYGNQIATTLEGKIIEQKTFDTHGREVAFETLDEKSSTIYDDLDRVIEKKNELTGLVTYISYDAYGNVTKEKDSEGLVTKYRYDEYHRKIWQKDVYGRIEKLTYDVRDNVIETKNFDGTVTSSVYDERGNVIESVDALGRITTNTYNIMNQLVKEKNGKKITEYVYDETGNQIEVKNIHNNTSTKTIYDKNGNTIETIDVLGNHTKSEYDAKNQLIASIDAKGNRLRKEYDAYGNVVKEIDPLGNTKQHQFNAYGQVIMDVDERGFETVYEYDDDLQLHRVIDSNGNKTTFRYNKKHQKISEKNANKGVTKYRYDIYGREIQVTQPDGRIDKKHYDELGNVIKEKEGKKKTVNRYDERGNLIETKVNGVIQVKNTYNKRNQIVKSEDANGNETTYRYDKRGNTIYTDEKGFITKSTYDIDGNLIRQVDNKTHITKNTYDAAGHLTQTIVNKKITLQKEYDENGNEIRIVEDGVEIHKAYDSMNRLIQVELPSAEDPDTFTPIQKLEYDESGNVTRTEDAFGNAEEKKYDAGGNVIEETGKNGSKTLYEYDALGNVIKVQNHEERYVSYAYDKMNNMIRKNIQDRYAQYKYDERGNLLEEKDEYGFINTYAYDDLDHKTKWIKPDGTIISYTYDPLGNKLSENDTTYTYDERNNLLTSTNEEGTVTNTYDVFNNKTSVTDTKGNIVTYTYNKDNLVTSKAYGDTEIHYSYNKRNLLTKVKQGKDIIAKYTYNKRNEIVRLKQPKTMTEKTYDDMGRIQTQKSMNGEEVLLDASYEYDANDNLIKETIDDDVNTYVYDGYDELKESRKYIDGKAVETSYSYDLYGNKVTSSSDAGVQTYTYNDKNQVETIKTDEGMIHFTYDDNGNVSEKKHEDGTLDHYYYDDLNQLVKLEKGDSIYEYRYDGEKERISEKSTNTREYHHDLWYDSEEALDVASDTQIMETFQKLREQREKIQENDDSCTLIIENHLEINFRIDDITKEFTLDRSMENAQVLKVEDGITENINVYGEGLLQTNDEEVINGWNDSIAVKTDGEIVKKYSYSDYGSTNDMRFGQCYNGETKDVSGLIYLRARYYDPEVSRFIQIDNHYDGEEDSVVSQNRYTYTLNNPYKYVDSDGQKAKKKKKQSAGLAIGAIQDFEKKKPLSPQERVVQQATQNLKDLTGTSENAVAKKPSFNGTSTKTQTARVNVGKTATPASKPVPKKPAYKTVHPTAKCPEAEKSNIDNSLDTLQDVLDWIGWIPGIGDIADGINAVISFLRGDYLSCMISVACLALPVVADAIFKPLKKIAKSAADFASKVIEKMNKAGQKSSKLISGITSFCNGVKSFVKSCWLIPGKIKTKVSGWIDSVKSYVSGLFEKAKNALSPKLATNTGANLGSNTTQQIVQEGTDAATNQLVKSWQRIANDMRIKGIEIGKWGKGTFDDAIDSCAYHFKKHGKEVGANSVEEYIRKANGFTQNLKGAKVTKVSGYTENVKRYRKNGKYIDLDHNGNIISFGI